MQLTKVHVVGLGRLSNASMKVRGKVTAIVGPNESGKSTLLRALASISSNNAVTEGPGGDIPRRTSPRMAATALDMTFTLDGEDLRALEHIPSESQPVRLVATKAYGGNVTYRIEPNARRPRAPRQGAAREIDRVVSALSQLDEDASEEFGEDAPQLLALAKASLVILDQDEDPGTFSEADIAELVRLVEVLEAAPTGLVDSEPVLIALRAMLDTERADHPTLVMQRELARRVPLIAFFSSADRDLTYEYNLEGMAEAGVPVALSNLAISARLDMAEMLREIAAGRWDAVAEQIGNANDALAALFEASWTAGSGTAAVHLDRDGTMLRIMVTSMVGRFSPISERSDGLRMFVALTTFVRARAGSERPVVLLIDEAENHLHYDAQADLMAVLGRQKVAAQVIYTTHSAGCLPDDLGGNIVAVVPDAESGLSSVNSSYWTAGFGFSPLMMAMGAGAAAITPSRYAILAEGHSEALILPRLIREATGLLRLGYQIAAGVAEAGRNDIPTLDAEAAHVAYLVDGDGGGKANARKLSRAGIPAARIIHLGGKSSGLCLEDLIDTDIYSACADDLRATSGLEPTKADVAARLIDIDERLLAADKSETLAALHLELSDALQIPEERRPNLANG